MTDTTTAEVDAGVRRTPGARDTARFVPPPARAGEHEDPYKYKYLIAIAVTLAAMLELIDTSIVNVAIPHMMGNLGATLDEISWVSTGYIIANVIVIPMSGWLSAYFGRKRYLTGSIVLFVGRLVLLRRRHVAGWTRLLARGAGIRRRRAAVHRAVHAVRVVPARRGGNRPGDVRRRRDGGTDDRSHARRLHRRQLQLALDLLHQRAARHPRGRSWSTTYVHDAEHQERAKSDRRGRHPACSPPASARCSGCSSAASATIGSIRAS